MFKILDEACKPTKGSKYSAGIDLYAREDVVIGAGETKLVPLGVNIDEDTLDSIILNYIESNYKHVFKKYDGTNPEELERDIKFYNNKFKKSHHLELFNRSSTAYKKGLFLANGTGIIDLDFEDEICAIFHNPIDLDFVEAIACQEVVTSMTGDTREIPLCGNAEIKKGDKICQIILKENKSYLMGIESEEERTGGFGSTGK